MLENWVMDELLLRSATSETRSTLFYSSSWSVLLHVYSIQSLGDPQSRSGTTPYSLTRTADRYSMKSYLNIPFCIFPLPIG